MDIRKLETDLRFRLLEKTFFDVSEVIFEEGGIIIKSPEYKLKIFVEYPEHKNNYIYSEILNCESLTVRSITHLTSLVEEFIREHNLIVDIMSNIDKKVHKRSKNIKITKEKIDFDGKVKLSDYSYQLYKLDGNMETVDNLYSFGENEIDDMLEFITKNNLNIVKFINNEEN